MDDVHEWLDLVQFFKVYELFSIIKREICLKLSGCRFREVLVETVDNYPVGSVHNFICVKLRGTTSLLP